jgi:hypothetical protein|tara:strand:+ start:419 stop:673 length:255 start_codon:yes stop_codon:yes gene_type:complete
MNRKFLKTTALLIATVIAGHSMLLAAEDKPKLPQTLTVKCELDPFPYALKPLGRDDNMMMPTVTVKSTVTRPTGSDIPAANFPR